MADKDKKIKIKSWYSNRYQIVAVQRNVLLLLTATSIIMVAIAVFFVKNFMSSKSLEPYVIEINEKTGTAVVVQQITSQTFTANEVMKRYFINKYVQSSLSYNPRNYKENSEEVRLFSTSQIFNEYRNRINPYSLGSESQIGVKIRSLLFKDNMNVEIRTTREIDIVGQKPATKNEIIYMTFYFAPELNLSIEERLINPLGFQVSKFEVAEEIINQ
ncbi:MAG: virB8 family protein [Alphaproteobacteria bacterium]